MVVKSKNAEVTEMHLFSELVGNLMAREFGVNTPKPGLVYIGAEFSNSLRFSPATKHLTLQTGYGVGCEYLRGLSPTSNFNTPNNEELADMQAIFGTDMLMQNPDRRPEKPNCASYQSGVLAYDFELAFSFLLPLFGQFPPAWEVDQQGLHHKYLFYSELKKRQAQLDWQPFLKRLEEFVDARMLEIFAATPAQWENYAKKVAAHLREVRTHLPRFHAALIRSLL